MELSQEIMRRVRQHQLYQAALLIKDMREWREKLKPGKIYLARGKK